MRFKPLLILVTCLFIPMVQAEETLAAAPTVAPVVNHNTGLEPQPSIPFISPVYEKIIKGDFNKIYQTVFTALENNGYFVVFEPNIGKQLERFKQRWGDKYNKNKIERIKSMIFCNAWYANEVSNMDPKLLAMCPMHITLTEKQGMVSLLFVRPSIIAKGSGAEKVALEIEQDVLRSIEEGLNR